MKEETAPMIVEVIIAISQNGSVLRVKKTASGKAMMPIKKENIALCVIRHIKIVTMAGTR